MRDCYLCYVSVMDGKDVNLLFRDDIINYSIIPKNNFTDISAF